MISTIDSAKELSCIAKINKSSANTCRTDSPEPMKQLGLSVPEQYDNDWLPTIFVLMKALSLQRVTNRNDYNGLTNVSFGVIGTAGTSSSLMKAVSAFCIQMVVRMLKWMVELDTNARFMERDPLGDPSITA